MTNKKWNELEAAPNPSPGRDYTVEIAVPEFTCVCPRTGLPDFGTIRIRYIPDKKIVELKSLKYYILNYRDLGIFQEAVNNRILDDLKELLRPRMIEVVADFNARGGIKTVVTSRWPDENGR
ncbi:MAG: NADPH-dependent 7-cyano-7-deazaguanine reductase QueF [Candidatus Marinimicrobia bacterium]|nr:NADPH-dependent 7-cyano-7-deazaguanine reductase QueF [Candidatus Neomarinimicrobiota bacterium]